MFYKSERMGGQMWSVSMSNATIHPDPVHSRQLAIMVGSAQVYLRVKSAEDRDAWVECLQQSVATYHR
jgi:hypothetical protein